MLTRLVLTACLACALGSAPSQVASQSCALNSGDSIADAIRRGCARITLDTGTYTGRFTVDHAVSISGASATANPSAAVITANGGPVITVAAEGDLQLSRVTLRGSGGEIVEPGGETAEPGGETAELDGETAELDGETAELDGETAELDGETAELDGETAELDGETAELDGETAELDGETAEPDGETAEPDGETAEPDGETAEPDGETAEPGDETLTSPDPNPRGGCIYNSGRASLDYVLVTQCFAAHTGGAVYNSVAASFSAVSSLFDFNRADAGSGGAIASGSGATLTLQDTDFSMNVAQGWGGAVSSSGAADSITGGDFSRNRAGGHGAAVAFLSGGGPVIVEGATFDSNRAGHYGGAMACFDRELMVRDGEVTDNRAEGGGGIYAARCDLTLDGFRLLGNTAGETTNGHGGGLMLQEGSLLVTDGWFEGNAAGHSGGAVFANVRLASITFEDTMVRDNHAQVAGGGICVADASMVQIHGSKVIFNTALQGGGAYLSNGSSSVKRSAFAGNYAGSEGGALLSSDASLVVENSTFASNVADQAGGGVYLRQSVVASVRNATLYGNEAGEHASGLFIDSGAAVGLSNTIVFDSGTMVSDCEVQGTLTVSGHNLDSDGSCSSDLSFDPRLEMLGSGATMASDGASVDDAPVDSAPVDSAGADDAVVHEVAVNGVAVNETAVNETSGIDPVTDQLAFQEFMFGDPGSGDAVADESPGMRIVALALRPSTGSPVIDAGDDEVCTDYDQNGTKRPQDGDGDGEPECNLGAIEQ